MPKDWSWFQKHHSHFDSKYNYRLTPVAQSTVQETPDRISTDFKEKLMAY